MAIVFDKSLQEKRRKSGGFIVEKKESLKFLVTMTTRDFWDYVQDGEMEKLLELCEQLVRSIK